MNKANKYTLGRPWHSRGQRFDPAYLHQTDLKSKDFRSVSILFRLLGQQPGQHEEAYERFAVLYWPGADDTTQKSALLWQTGALFPMPLAGEKQENPS